MRAPPEAVTETSGTSRAAPRSRRRATNFSPTTLPIEPPMNAKSITASWQGCRSIVALPITIASPSPVSSSASASRSVYGRRSKKPSGSAERRSAASSTKRARVGELLDPLARRDREVVAALRADAQVSLELVVAVVRAAGGTGVRDALLRRRLGVACLCSIETSILRVRHGPDLRPAAALEADCATEPARGVGRSPASARSPVSPRPAHASALPRPPRAAARPRRASARRARA